MKFLRSVLFAAHLILLPVLAAAQDENPKPETTAEPDKNFWDRIYIGGNLGLQFGSSTVINLSPQVGYRVTERFIPGIGITYIYYNFRDRYTNTRYETSVYGGSLFAKYFFTQHLFAHVEYEELNLEAYDYYLGRLSRIWVPSLFVGGGYSQPIGQRGFIQLMILYEVMQDKNSPYFRNNPVLRIGFGF